MKTYAEVNSDNVVIGLYESDGGPPQSENAVHELVGWPGLPPKSSPHHVMIWADGAVAFGDPRSLAEAKEQKVAEINAARLAANQSHFTFAGKLIACDPLSRGDISGVSEEVGLTQQLPANFPGAWKALDNSYVPIPDVATWTLFVKAMVSQGTANFAKSQALKAAVDSASTLEEVDAIAW